MWNEETYGQTSNLLTGVRSKVNSEGEFIVKARIEDEDYEYGSDSESESDSELSEEFSESSDDDSE